MRPIPTIIDTDFGGDPDDAVALAYALKSPELDIRAIITSDEYKENHRALLLKQWLKSAGSAAADIPVFSGHDLDNKELFLLEDLIEAEADGGAPSIFHDDGGIGAALAGLAADGGHYVSIGGLSNLKYLQSAFPAPWNSIRTTIMGGAVKYHRAGAVEHNIGLDLDSARAVFENGLRQRWILSDHTFAPELSVSRSHRLYSYFTGQPGFFHSLVRANMDRFFDAFYPDSRIHDPLTISSLFLPTVKFSVQKILFTPAPECAFRLAAEGIPAEISISADYALFWKDVDKKMGLSSQT